MDSHIEIHKWRDSVDTENNEEVQEAPPLASIHAICSDLYLGLLNALCEDDTVTRPVFLSLQRSQSYIILWAQSYGVADGDLDKSIHKSRRARLSTFRLLSSIAKTLTYRMPFMSLFRI